MRILLALAFATFVYAQEFEAASVKPAAPPTQGRFRVGSSGGPGSSDPGRVSYTGMSMKDLVAIAYEVKRTQVTGPDWIDSERYDITATMAPTTTKAQFSMMLQKLLAERFKLQAHREKKEMSAFVLTVGKKGPKMKESVPEPPKEDDPKPNDPPPPPDPGRMAMGKDGFPQLPPGRRAGPMMMIMPGKAKLTAKEMTMEQFAGSLDRFLNQPVVDQTGLKGKYDFELVFAPDMAQMFGGRGPMMMGPPPGGGPELKADDADVAPLPVALQEQLGLKLDSQKTQVDIVAIDRAEKVPTEN
ncbi:MAG TPA: TIGR03435 family protein [Bryobacteraceae bacterium]|nr:TIGR03435 family protein [Bryobacteraceae bacterium]